MVKLKSYRLKLKKKKKKRRGDLITGGVIALLGIALLSETAGAVRRI